MGEVAHEVVVEELAAVVTVEAQDVKGQGLFDVLELLQHALLAPSPDGPLSVQVVAISTQSRLFANWPAMEAPQWATVSASRKPGWS